MQLDEKDLVIKFEMNDKCSAGTGKFVEVLIKRILNVPIEELCQLSLMSKNPCIFSSICTVFAESEIISLLTENKTKEDTAYGINKAIAKRVIGMGSIG